MRNLAKVVSMMPKRRRTIIPQKTLQPHRAAKQLKQCELVIQPEDDHGVHLRQTAHTTRFCQQFVARTYPPNVNSFTLGKMNQICYFCTALQFKGENLNCCHKGKVTLPPLASYPEELRLLLTIHTAQSRNFCQYIRQYNSSLAFA